MRELGITKVEMGVQTTSDEVQKLTGRGHTLKDVISATKLLKDAGFKIGYHMMPNLPGSTPDLDKKMVAELFQNSGYQPDYLKIYPCVVISKTVLSLWHKQGKYQPYDDKTLESIILAELKSIPEWCRVDRISRDIPSNEIEVGSKISNVRQILENKLKKSKYKLREIRSREVGAGIVELKNIKSVLRKYDASDGKELFLSFEDKKNDKLIALLRLRFPSETFMNALKNTALIREVHVYGPQVAVGNKQKGVRQHTGFGKKLLQKAEILAVKNGYKKIAVIAGIGTREYYKKFGYKLKDTYMVKSLN
jgi:elongator complex protein 3